MKKTFLFFCAFFMMIFSACAKEKNVDAESEKIQAIQERLVSNGAPFDYDAKRDKEWQKAIEAFPPVNQQKFNYATDFPEYEEVRDWIYEERSRNYTNPYVLYKSFYPTTAVSDKSEAIYYALYIMENLKDEYISLELLSSLVQAFTNLPLKPSSAYYAKVYCSMNLQVDYIFCFLMTDTDCLWVDVFSSSPDSKREWLNFEIDDASKDSCEKWSLKKLNGSLNTRPEPDREVIRGIWFALWNFYWQSDDEFISPMEAAKLMYKDVSIKLLDNGRSEFFKASNTIDSIIAIYEEKFGKLSTLERLAFIELVQRCYISGL